MKGWRWLAMGLVGVGTLALSLGLSPGTASAHEFAPCPGGPWIPITGESISSVDRNGNTWACYNQNSRHLKDDHTHT